MRTASKSITPFDVIADIDLCRIGDRATSDVLIDARDGFLQQVGASVNVTDGIDTRIGRQCRLVRI
jgi:hypothetical protein